MVAPTHRFQIFIVTSMIVFALILRFATRKRPVKPGMVSLIVLTVVVVAGGMYFAVFGEKNGWPWWVYYSTPALTTLLLPPKVLKMSKGEAVPYVALAFLSSPGIHIVFSFLFDWHEYMPFLDVPSLASML